MTRVSVKVTGAQGQGVNSVGELLAKGLKRAGYCVFGYREYNSLIKGGHSSYQLDISSEKIGSTEQKVNVLVCFNHHGLELNLREMKDGGIVIHQSPDWTFSREDEDFLKKRNITMIEFPVAAMLAELKAKPILGNMLITATVWSLLGRSPDELKELAKEQFAKKKDLLDLNYACVDRGFQFKKERADGAVVTLPKPDNQWSKQLLLNGSEAMGLGAIHAGVRLYAGYPMTPSSPLLSFIASLQNETGMVIKQAEDEITAAQMVSGAMHMGCRALTATSGGGFDLMSETLSLNAIIENPTVFVLAQRPGPATGLPTWTAQGDLLMAVHTSHGEFARCVIGVSDSQDAFDLMPVAFNLAEKFQISVIVLTDKQVAEAIYTQTPYDLKKATLERGIVTDQKELSRLQPSDRYRVTDKDGISPRWLPGSKAATYNAQGDEHNAEGDVDESGPNAKAQMEKRMRKVEALKKSLPEPVLIGAEKPDLLLVGWGSTKPTVEDVLKAETLNKKKIGYLHYEYLYPLKTEKLEKLMKTAKKTVLVEGNFQGQLGMLISQECGVRIEDKILKYDGRPFFYDELLSEVSSRL